MKEELYLFSTLYNFLLKNFRIVREQCILEVQSVRIESKENSQVRILTRSIGDATVRRAN